MNLTKVLINLLVCFVLYSCAPGRMVQTELYFGQAKPDGSMVSEQEWDRFRKEQLARVFKEGSTILNATGNWYDPEKRKLITEPTYVVVYLYKPSRVTSLQVDSLRHWYKTRFQQQSVLRVDKKVKVAF